MKQQKLKLECVKYAAKVVATMDVENKSKALFDLAAQIEMWVSEDKKEWFDIPTPRYGQCCTFTVDQPSEYNKQKE